MAVTTAIYKAAVEGPVAVRKLNLEGDAQADRAVHGGEEKAVYAYPHEHYASWSRESPSGACCGSIWRVITAPPTWTPCAAPSAPPRWPRAGAAISWWSWSERERHNV